MKTFLFLGFAFCTLFFSSRSAESAASRRSPTAQPGIPGLSPADQVRESQAAYHLIEAILVAPDMTFKMPVLAAAFRDCPEWEQRLQHIIGRESWSFAKVNFIHFYWQRVSQKNPEFMARMLDYVATARKSDSLLDSLGIVDDMMSEKRK